MAGRKELVGKGTSWLLESYALYDIDVCDAKEMAAVLVAMVMVVATCEIMRLTAMAMIMLRFELFPLAEINIRLKYIRLGGSQKVPWLRSFDFANIFSAEAFFILLCQFRTSGN